LKRPLHNHAVNEASPTVDGSDISAAMTDAETVVVVSPAFATEALTVRLRRTFSRA